MVHSPIDSYIFCPSVSDGSSSFAKAVPASSRPWPLDQRVQPLDKAQQHTEVPLPAAQMMACFLLYVV